MYAKLIHVVMLLQMLVHGIFGCCCHHAHAYEPSAPQHEVASKIDLKKHSCRHHIHDRHLSESSDSPVESERMPDRDSPCDDDRCQFVKDNSTRFSEFKLRWLFGDGCRLGAHVLVQRRNIATVSCLRLDRPGETLTPVDRCALLHAWLI